MLGRAKPTDRWCPGCSLFTFLSEGIQAEINAEANRQPPPTPTRTVRHR